MRIKADPRLPRNCRECESWTRTQKTGWNRAKVCGGGCQYDAFGPWEADIYELWCMCATATSFTDSAGVKRAAYEVKPDLFEMMKRAGHPAFAREERDGLDVWRTLRRIQSYLTSEGESER